MNWLTFFIPSWRFFDRFGYVSKFEIQVYGSEEVFFIQAPPIKITRVFFNSDGNYYLYQLSTIQRFIENVGSAGELQQNQIEKLTSFHYLNLVIQHEIFKKLNHVPSYQFQILVNTGNGYDLFYQSEVQTRSTSKPN